MPMMYQKCTEMRFLIKIFHLLDPNYKRTSRLHFYFMSEQVPFILRDWTNRRRTAGIRYGEAELLQANNEHLSREPIPQFANIGQISLDRWGQRIDTRALPGSCSAFSGPILKPDASTEIDEYSDIDIVDSEDSDLVGALPLQRDMPNHHCPVNVHLLNTDHLSQAQIDLVMHTCAEETEYHNQVRAVATLLRDQTPSTTWANIGLIFGLNGGTIYRHVTGAQWFRVSRERATEVRHWQFSKTRIKCSS